MPCQEPECRQCEAERTAAEFYKVGPHPRHSEPDWLTLGASAIFVAGCLLAFLWGVYR